MTIVRVGIVSCVRHSASYVCFFSFFTSISSHSYFKNIEICLLCHSQFYFLHSRVRNLCHMAFLWIIMLRICCLINQSCVSDEYLPWESSKWTMTQLILQQITNLKKKKKQCGGEIIHFAFSVAYGYLPQTPSIQHLTFHW